MGEPSTEQHGSSRRAQRLDVQRTVRPDIPALLSRRGSTAKSDAATQFWLFEPTGQEAVPAVEGAPEDGRRELHIRGVGPRASDLDGALFDLHLRERLAMLLHGLHL